MEWVHRLTKSFWRVSIKVDIRKMEFHQNNDVRGRIVGYSYRCQNLILETLIDVKN